MIAQSRHYRFILQILMAIGITLQAPIVVSAENPKPSRSVNQSEKLLNPTQIELPGNERRVTMSSVLGPIELRWQREVEAFFGRTPERSLVEATTSISRALKKGGFPPRLESLNIKWNIIFFGENLPPGQVPQALISGCHPGWMTGTAEEVNIYIRAQAVVMGCGGGSKPSRGIADEKLAQVIIHEFGHGIERVLLLGHGLGDRLRAEGFATWFEQYVAGSSPLLRSSNLPEYYKKLAQYRYRNNSGVFTFSGTALDYAYASMYFLTIQSRFGVRGIFSVYQTMIDEKITFFEAISSRHGWSKQKLESEVLRLLE